MPKLRLVEKPAQGTKYEQLQAQRAQHQESKARLECGIANVEKDLDRAILDNKSTDELRKQRLIFVDGVRKMELEIEQLDREIAMAEPEHLRSKIAELDHRRREIAREGAEQADKYNAMRKEFREFEAQYKGDADERGRELDRLSDQRHSLEWRLRDLEGQHGA